MADVSILTIPTLQHQIQLVASRRQVPHQLAATNLLQLYLLWKRPNLGVSLETTLCRIAAQLVATDEYRGFQDILLVRACPL